MDEAARHAPCLLRAPHSINILTAMATHASATYGDKRSPTLRVSFIDSGQHRFPYAPILADIQNNPRNLRKLILVLDILDEK